MIPWIPKSDSLQEFRRIASDEPYLVVNFMLAGVILLIFIYSGIFSPVKDNYPVMCIHERLTGEPCASCGLSHSLSLILRGRLTEALLWNPYGLRVFIFFAGQLIMRILFSAYYMRNTLYRRELIIYDSAVSFMLLIICFLPFIEFIFRFL